ncbi:MAG: glycosyltransferase family A protein, partial [Gammaproteobacteria bacterium]
TYNRNDLLPRAIKSVLAQSRDDFEIIVVDNANDPLVKDVVAGFSDDRINLIQDSTRRGAAVARNIGVAHARSDLIAFLDDDDEYRCNFIEEVSKAFSDYNIDFLWCGTIQLFPHDSDNGYDEKEKFVKDVPSRPMEFVLRIGTGCGFCIKKKAFDAVGGFDEMFKVSEDRDLVLSLLEAGFDFIHLDKLLYRRYYHNEQRLSDSTASLEEAKCAERLLSKHKNYLANYKLLRLKILDLVAKKYYQGGDLNSALATAYFAWKQSPFRVKGLRRLLRYAVKKHTSRMLASH